MDLTRESLDQSARGDRRIVITQMALASLLILGGGIMGLVAMGYSSADAQIALALGTAVIGAGAAMLPTGAAAGASARILHLPEPYAAQAPAPREAPADPEPERPAREASPGEPEAKAPRVVGVTAPVRLGEIRQYTGENHVVEEGADLVPPPALLEADEEDAADFADEAPPRGGAVRGGVEPDL